MTRRIIAFLMALTLMFAIAIHAFATTSDNGDTIVYRTNTGECYHRHGCSYLRRSCIEITLREAVERGLRPCSRCSPPRYNGPDLTTPSRSSSQSSSASPQSSDSKSSASNNTNSDSKTNTSNYSDKKSESTETRQQRTQRIRLWLIGIVGFGVFAAVVVVFTKNAISNKRAAEERRKREEQFLAEKEAFIAKLNGRTLRDAAGIPPEIILKNGLPVDNNDAEYGSYTVYRTFSGSCYHDKQGCCFAHLPTHYFVARPRLKPCSKCCVKHREIPQWYFEYRSLRKQTEEYHIDYAE